LWNKPGQAFKRAVSKSEERQDKALLKARLNARLKALLQSLAALPLPNPRYRCRLGAETTIYAAYYNDFKHIETSADWRKQTRQHCFGALSAETVRMIRAEAARLIEMDNHFGYINKFRLSSVKVDRMPAVKRTCIIALSAVGRFDQIPSPAF
jgi:hypothetical protein